MTRKKILAIIAVWLLAIIVTPLFNDVSYAEPVLGGGSKGFTLSGVNVTYKNDTMKVGETQTATVTFDPKDIVGATVTGFRSSDSSIISVDSKGTIKALKASNSSVRIYVTAQDLYGTIKTGSFEIKKVSESEEAKPITINADKTELKLRPNETGKIRFTVSPATSVLTFSAPNASNFYTYSYQKGANGVYTVTVKAKKSVSTGVPLFAKCGYVERAVPVVIVAQPQLSFNKSANRTIYWATDEDIEYDDSIIMYTTPFDIEGNLIINPSDAQVDLVYEYPENIFVELEGSLYGIKDGKGKLKVTDKNSGARASIELTTKRVRPIRPSEGDKLLLAGDKLDFKKLLPEGVKASKVTWESSDSNVVSINKNGMATAKSAGKATIKGIWEELTILEYEVTVVSINASVDLRVGESITISKIVNNLTDLKKFGDVYLSNKGSTNYIKVENGTKLTLIKAKKSKIYASVMMKVGKKERVIGKVLINVNLKNGDQKIVEL